MAVHQTCGSRKASICLKKKDSVFFSLVAPGQEAVLRATEFAVGRGTSVESIFLGCFVFGGSQVQATPVHFERAFLSRLIFGAASKKKVYIYKESAKTLRPGVKRPQRPSNKLEGPDSTAKAALNREIAHRRWKIEAVFIRLKNFMVLTSTYRQFLCTILKLSSNHSLPCK